MVAFYGGFRFFDPATGADPDVLDVTGARVNLGEDMLAGQEQAGSVFAVTGTGCTRLPEPRFRG